MSSRLSLYVSEGPDLAHYSLDVDNAALSRQGTVSTPQEIQYVWVHPSSRYLYVASSNGVANKEHFLTAFKAGPDGALSPHGDPLRLRLRPIHLTVDPTGNYLLTAYNKPSTATVHRIAADGRIGEEIPQPKDLAGGFYAHQIRMLPSNRAAVLVARGTHRPDEPSDPGSLQVYGFADGVLSNKDKIAPDDHFGPRHLDFHPTKPWMYVSLEHQNEIQMFSIQNDTFSQKPLSVGSLLKEPDNVRPRQMGGTIHVHPNGKTVYVANRADYRVEHEGKKVFGGGENDLAVFQIDQGSGAVKRLQLVDPQGFYIRCFAIDPSGRLLVTASLIDMNVLENGTVRHVPKRIALFRIGDDGRLTLARSYDVGSDGRKQWWMNIAELPK